MTTKATINRLASGVPGLDEVLGGGLPEFSFNLIAGQPGCGKTTLAHQIMFALATPERPAIYFTVLGEPPLKMLRYQQQFDFFDSEAVNRSVRFVSLSEDAMAGDLDRVLGRIADEVSTHNPGLVFVDSFRSVVSANENGGSPPNSLQLFVQQLGMLMTSWQATTFLIGEYFNETDANPVFTVADGLIWLRQSVQRNSMVRKMEIMKMRGQATLPGLHTFRIDSGRHRVFAPASVVAAGAAAPRRGGRAGADGRAGAGRDARRRPAAGLFAARRRPFGVGQEHPGRFLPGRGRAPRRDRRRRRLRAAPQPSAQSDARRPDRAREGRAHRQPGAGPVDRRDRAADPDRGAPARREPRRARFAQRFRAGPGADLPRPTSASRCCGLVTALARAGVSVLMTSELEDRYTDLRFSPYGAAFLTDAIIVQRYIEVESRLLRVMAVVKVRASAHSDELRLYTIGDDGIRMGEMLPDQEGLLGGRPTRKRSAGLPAPSPSTDAA